MPGFLRAATIVLGSSAVLGASVLAALPSAPEGGLFARWGAIGVPVADLPRASCKQQLWPNTDRICQSWTIAQPDTARYLSAKLEAPTPAAVVAAADTIAEHVTLAPSADLNKSDRAPPNVMDSSTPVDERIIAGETVEDAQMRALRSAQEKIREEKVQEDKAKVAATRSREGQNGIAVTARAGDGRARVIIIRPTSRQDHLYYSVHRDLAATTFPLRQ